VSLRKSALRLGAAAVVLGVLLASAAFVALGAPTGWPTYQHDAGRSAADPDTPPVASLTAGWSTQLDARLHAQPLVLGTLIAGQGRHCSLV